MKRLTNKSLEDHEVQLSQAELSRYSRHLSLPEIGLSGQNLLKASSVLCVGSGGLGSPLLLYLAAAGVGNIGITDFDLVEDSNLQRQIIHGTSWLGKPKTESARDRILEINPYCKVTIFQTRLTSTNALEIIKPFDLVCDCTDNFPSRYLINDSCVLLGKPMVYGSVGRFEGNVTVFNLHKESPNYRDLFPSPPPEGEVLSCEESGVIGVLPGLIGVIQATEAIKIIAGFGEPLDGRLLTFDAVKMKFKELRLCLDKNREPIDRLIDYQEFCSSKIQIQTKDHNLFESISVKELKNLLEKNSSNVSLVDVRNHNEYDLQSISGANLIPLKEIKSGEAIEKIRELAKKSRLYLHCKSGKRSIKALIELKRHGIDGVNVSGGIDAWNAEFNT